LLPLLARAVAVLIPLVVLSLLAIVVFAIGGSEAFIALAGVAILFALVGGALWLTRIVLNWVGRRQLLGERFAPE
jgi:hypothetical protein